MEKWYQEDWRFKIEILKVGVNNNPRNCRLGFEPGDVFESEYETPAGFCPTSFIEIFPVMELVRNGGDLRNMGRDGVSSISFLCPDGIVRFNLTVERNKHA